MKKLSLVLVVFFVVGMVAYGQESGWREYGDTVRLRQSSDKVGIGITSPLSKLHVQGSLSGPVGDEYKSAIYGYNTATSYSPVGIYGKVNASGGKAVYGYNSNSGGYAGYFYGRGYFSGNVGIGTTSLGEKLTVNGNLKILGNNKITSGGILTVEGNPSSFYAATLKLDQAGDAYLFGGTGGSNPHNVILAHTGTEARGNVGIGTNNPQTRLAVNGTITAKEIKIKLTGWSDFVFEDNYKLMPLDKLERHIKKEKSLPGIPNNKEVIEDGVKLGEMQAKLLEKVEELTLYVIEQNKELTELKKQVVDLRKKNKALTQKISSLSN